MTKRSLLELVLGCAGAAYLALVFCKNIYSPLFGLIVLSLSVYELVDTHRARNKP